MYLIDIELQHVGQSFLNLHHLHKLSLRDNPNAGINWTQLPNAQHLDLNNTSMVVPESVPFINITHLELSNNHVNASDILLRLKSLNQLKFLSLSYNNFEQLDDWMRLLELFPHLKGFHLEGNSFLSDQYRNIRNTFCAKGNTMYIDGPSCG